MTLGEIIKKLEAFKEVLGKNFDERYIVFDFAGLVPGTFSSYRGYYDQLALDWEDGEELKLAKDFLEQCKNIVGKIYTGYKGGDFKMDEDTPVWVAKYSRCEGTYISGISDDGYWSIILETKKED